MKILLLTQYYPPEIGAPQNRLSGLAVRLRKMGDEVTVLTAMPNYPHQQIHEAYKGKKRVVETIDGVPVHRTRIFVRKSRSVFLRLLNYFSFVWSSYWYARKRLGGFDLIICESPPLFLGITAMCLKKVKKCRLLFNVSDLWPESAEKLGIITNRILLNMALNLEHRIYRKSDLITGQTQGIIADISGRFPGKPFFWLKNGIDTDRFFPRSEGSGWRTEFGFDPRDFLVFYGGILGYAQGLEVIIRAAGMLLDIPRLKFVIAGEGPLKVELMAMAQKDKLSGISFLPAFRGERMPEVIDSIDAAIIPLRKLDLFRGAIPSKIVENLAMKKPILLGVEGEAKEIFIDQGKCGLFFTPENAEELAGSIKIIMNDKTLYNQLSENAYAYVREHFSRDRITKEFRQFILHHLSETGGPDLQG
jgi:glycosyltransferase involved in cell wall biosynthesis